MAETGPARRSWLGGTLALLSGAALLVAVAAAMSDGRAVLDAWARFSGAAFGLALLAVLANYALRFWRWQRYLHVLAVDVRRGLSLLIFLSGFLMSVSPGKLGEVLKSALLYQYRGVAVARTAPVVLAERLLDLVALVLLVTLASGALRDGPLIAAGGALVVAGILLSLLWTGLFEWGLGLLERLPIGPRLAPRLREAHRSLRALLAPGPLLWGTGLGLLGWSLECLATWLIVRGFDGPHLNLVAASFSYAAGTLAGALAMLPGGLGVAEAGMAGLMVATSDHRIDPEVALVATLLVRFATLWFGVLLGAVAFGALRLTQRPRTA